MAKQNQTIIFLVLLIAGVALIAWGFNEHGAFGNKLARSLSGRTSDRVMLMWIAGGALSLIGAFGLFRRR